MTSNVRTLFFCNTFVLLFFLFIPCSFSGEEGSSDPSVTTEVVSRSDSNTSAESSEKSVVPSEVSQKKNGVLEQIDYFFGLFLVKPLSTVLMWDFGTKKFLGESVPCFVAWLFIGALFFTLRMRFINLRAFRHSIELVCGKYTKRDEVGEVSHFQALSSALSGTVGLGNIGAVALAVSVGGPGAVFWLVLMGFLLMSTKFSECSLALIYRRINPDGTVSGGPMYYLRDGLAQLRLGKFSLRSFGLFLAISYAIACLGQAFAGGSSFQISQSLSALRMAITDVQDVYPWAAWLIESNRLGVIYGTVMTIVVGLVIFGGFRRIAATASRVVPFMCLLYLCLGGIVLVCHYRFIPDAFGLIFKNVFGLGALQGGFFGAMIMGVMRSALSSEAGLGSAAIAHSAARTDEPIKEGIVALLEPFIDTVMVCTMTGLLIVTTQVAINHPDLVEKGQGAALTLRAIQGTIWWGAPLLVVAVILFAFSTVISWSYYGDRAWCFLTGGRFGIAYRLLFLTFVFLGGIVTANNIVSFCDLVLLSMAFPNILGVMLLSGQIKKRLDIYWASYKKLRHEEKDDRHLKQKEAS